VNALPYVLSASVCCVGVLIVASWLPRLVNLATVGILVGIGGVALSRGHALHAALAFVIAMADAALSLVLTYRKPKARP
jgi:hypothetical protein